MTFHNEERIPPEAGHHAHESPTSMTLPLIVLAVLAAIAGGALYISGLFESFLMHTPSLVAAARGAAHGAEEHAGHGWIGLVSFVIALVGIGLAAFLYLGDQREVQALSKQLQFRQNPRLRGVSPYQLSSNKFFFDEIYNLLIVRPLELLADLSYWIDRRLIDGMVNLVGRTAPALGSVMRSLQMGLVQFYALAMILGVLILLVVRLWTANG
jgi:NADH-quinone oxidoreductase subunit L